jgi:Soluble lytic murein transglycosylase and related regulatory proteins (some contain LysM/invasin domains)
VGLLRDGDPQSAADELQALQARGVHDDLRGPVALNLGLALNQLRRYEDSNRVLEPLAAGPYRVAIPAIYTASKNYRVLAASLNPMVTKTIVVRQQVGTIKVKAKAAKGKKAKVVTKPRFANVKKNVQLVDLAKKAKKENWDHLANERLKDLLSLPLSRDIRIEVLNTLIAIAEPKNQDDYEQSLIRQVVQIDPGQDPGLQHFWDKAWGLYSRGDFRGAREVLVFLRDSYRSPNVKRQASYWYARCGEKMGNKDEAKAIYAQLAQAPYDDIYAVQSEQRGAVRAPRPGDPFAVKRTDWREIAEKSMPQELRLAYELTALSDMRDALPELKANRTSTNQQFADALLSDLYSSSGDTTLMMLSLKRAFPQLATVEQDAVPPYFLKMYYPARYQSDIRKYSQKNGVDPFIVMGLIHQESYFNPKARSAVGAAGLMQLMPSTAKELAGQLHTSTHLEDPVTNIKLGTAHFKMLVNLFGGNTDLAIASYNAGQGRIAQWRRAAPGRPMDEFVEAIPYRETRTYVKHVVMLASTYRRMNLQ